MAASVPASPADKSETDPGAVRIVEACNARLRAQVFRLRYAVSVVEMNKAIAAADHAARELRDELDEADSTILCALAGDEVVATIRLTWGGPGLPPSCHEQFALHLFAPYPLAAISFTSRLVVHQAWRGTTVLGKLFNHGYALSRERGSRLNFCHCTPALVKLYEQVGYRRYGPAIVDPDVGYHIPLLMLTEDAEHLKRVGSPLQRVARRFDNPDDTARWFRARFPEYSLSSASALRSEVFVHELAEKLFETGIPLFKGMAARDTELFISASTVLRCRAGDHIVRQGDVGNEMFLILTGAAEVQRSAAARRYTIATLGEGEIFGEMAFLSSHPRSASVVALTNLEVLVLSQHLLRKLMKNMPATTIQVLFNLALILCGRLNLCTERLLTQLSIDHTDHEEANREQP